MSNLQTELPTTHPDMTDDERIALLADDLRETQRELHALREKCTSQSAKMEAYWEKQHEWNRDLESQFRGWTTKINESVEKLRASVFNEITKVKVDAAKSAGRGAATGTSLVAGAGGLLWIIYESFKNGVPT